MVVAVKEVEKPVQDSQRIARLESDVAHVQVDELKLDVRKVIEKIEAIKDSLSDFKTQTEQRFAQLEGRIEVRFAKLNMSRALDKVWWLLGMATVLGVMARGFKWI